MLRRRARPRVAQPRPLPAAGPLRVPDCAAARRQAAARLAHGARAVDIDAAAALVAASTAATASAPVPEVEEEEEEWGG